MAHFNESKAEDRVLPKPALNYKHYVDVCSTLISGTLLISLVLRLPIVFFIAGIVFVSRVFTSDYPIDWAKATMPLFGILPSLAKLTYEVFRCLLTGEPL